MGPPLKIHGSSFLKFLPQRQTFQSVSLSSSKLRNDGVLTHTSNLFPIPIAVIVNDRILTVSAIHLTCRRANLVALHPILLRCLTMEVAGRFHIARRIKVVAVVDVVPNVHSWDGPAYARHRGRVRRKPSIETVLYLHRV